MIQVVIIDTDEYGEFIYDSFKGGVVLDESELEYETCFVLVHGYPQEIEFNGDVVFPCADA